MERVKKGEKYWVIWGLSTEMHIECFVEDNDRMDDFYFNSGDYFTSEAEAEAMAEKIRKVLQGADVIEMPSEAEIKDKAIDIAINIRGDEDCEEAAIHMTEWLKSKIVK